MASRTIRALTAVGLSEATVFGRGGKEAASSAARLAQGLGVASLYHSPEQDKWAYGIKSKSTGGAKKPDDKSFSRVAQIFPGGRIATSPSKTRMSQQLARINKSSRLSPEERDAYMQAALKKKGRRALPGEIHQAVKQSSYGVPRNRIKRDKPKTSAALDKLGGLLSRIKRKLSS